MATVPFSLGGLLPRQCQDGAVAIGNFDGVHLGHQALLAETVRQARLCSGPAVAVTFSPHPLQILRPDSFQPEITTLAERVELLHHYGAQHVVVLQTTPALLRLSAREFFEQIICDRLRARSVVEGFNFGFGRGREGTVARLQAFGKEKNVAVVLVPPLELAGTVGNSSYVETCAPEVGPIGNPSGSGPQPVSSSRVRNELLAGNVAMARSLLGREFRLTGVVRSGQKRGQTLGFPTANLADIATLIPGNGVYAARAHHAGKTWPTAVNIGPNPTFGENIRKVEAHLISFQGDLYGQTLTLDFVERLRDTRPFAGVQELKQQLQEDVARTLALL